MNVKSFYGSKKRLASPSLNELIDSLSTHSFTSADIFISPPPDESEGDSEHSDVETAAGVSFVDHLTSKILAAPAEASVCGNIKRKGSIDAAESKRVKRLRHVAKGKTAGQSKSSKKSIRKHAETSNGSEGDSEHSDVESAACSNSFVDHLTPKILAAPTKGVCGNVEHKEDNNATKRVKRPIRVTKGTTSGQSKSSNKSGEKHTETAAKRQKMSNSDSGGSGKITVTEPRKSLKIAVSWIRGRLTSKIDVTSTGNPQSSATDTAGVVKDPLDLFQLFWDDEFFIYIKQQSEMYAKQKKPTCSFEVSVDELKIFIAILLVSGYSTLPRRDMYWSLDADLRNEAVAAAMSRNRFREILRYIHFSDNLNVPDNDKYAKIRPLIMHLNEKFMTFLPSDAFNVDVDESMVPYYSHHSCKQRIQGKPIRYGFKFWSMNTSTGYLISTEPYQGKGTALSHTEYGLGGSVVLTFADKLTAAYPGRCFSFFIDNFFTGLPLVKEMTKVGYGCTGTVRSNRIENCPLGDRKLDKDARGTIKSFVSGSKDLIVLSWKDNATVRMASNCYGVDPVHSARRYSSAEKKHITVPIPDVVTKYNASMGGTDQMDRNISEYRIKMRNNKWWWQIFTHLLSASLSNAWFLRRWQISNRKTLSGGYDGSCDEAQIEKMDLLGFIRSVASSLLLLSASDRSTPGRPTTANKPLVRKVPDTVRSNTIVVHHPVNVKQGRCKVCQKNTTLGCGVCRMNMHPVVCYKIFHELRNSN